MSDHEQDIQDLVSKFNQQTQALTGPSSFPKHNAMPQTPSFDNQGFASEKVSPGIMQSGPAPTPAPTGNVCSQCGTMHPPLRPGEKCPNAASKIKDEKTNSVIDVNKYLTTFQSILISQIESKKIKDVQKLYQNITLEMTKFLEGYKE